MNNIRMNSESSSHAASKNRAGKSGNIIFLAIIMFLSFIFLSFKSESSLGGFHSFNEGWYSYIAANYDSIRSFLFPTIYTGRVDYNVSPLLSYLLYFSGEANGWQEWSLRIIPIIFSIMTLPAIYLIGSRFFGNTAGLAATAFMAFSPVNSIVGRNIQTDALYVCLMMWSLLAYLKSEDNRASRLFFSVTAGLLFGISFMAKQFVVLLPPSIFLWETARHRGIKWLGWRHLAFAVAAAAILSPYFGYHFFHHSSLIFGSQGSVLASGRLHALGFDTANFLATEILWGLSPAIAALFIAGLFCSFTSRNPGGSLCLFAIAVFMLFFTVWHGHSYYMLFMTPFCCLMAGAFIGAMKRKVSAIIFTTVSTLVAFSTSVLLLCAVKYGYDEFGVFSQVLKNRENTVIVATNLVAGSYYPVLKYYNRDVTTVTSKELAGLGAEKVNFGADKDVVIVGLAGIDDLGMPARRAYIKRRQFAPVIAGRAFFVTVTSEHFFNIVGLKTFKVGNFSDWGLRELGTTPSLVAGFVDAGADIPLVGDNVDFGLRPKNLGRK